MITPESFSLGGIWGKRLESVVENWALKVDDDFLLSGFRKKPGSQKWIGEHVGKFIDGAIGANLYVRNDALKHKVQRLAEELVKCQENDGYLGTYPPETRWDRKPISTSIEPPETEPFTWNWDPWVFKYAICGLVDYYTSTNWQPALAAAQKAADLLIHVYGPKGAHDLNASDENNGLASGSILEAIMMVYQVTREDQYLAFGRYIITHYWTREDRWAPRIIPVLKKREPINTIGKGKAYEMISCFVGLLEYCRVTGETEYLSMLVDARDRTAQTMRQIIGSLSDAEHLNESGNISEYACLENCVAFSWMQFNLRLYEFTGDACSLDLAEETAWNHIISALCPDGSTFAYFFYLRGVKGYYHWSQEGFPGQNKGAPMTCCQTNGLRAFALYPRYFYTLDQESTFTVNLIGSSKATFNLPSGTVTIEQVTDFPQSGVVNFKIATSSRSPIKVKIRKPHWAEKVAFDETGIGLSLRESWIYFAVEGSAAFTIRFEMKLALVTPGFVNRGKYGLKYGPLVFAVDSCPDGWQWDEIGIRIRLPEFLRKITIQRENGGWPMVELDAMQCPAGIGELSDPEFLNCPTTAKVRLRPLMFAGIGRNLEYAQSIKTSGMTYDRASKELLPYRVLFPVTYLAAKQGHSDTKEGEVRKTNAKVNGR